MRRLTLKEVNEQHGGALPPDAVFRPDEDEEPARPAPPAKPKRRSRSERFAALNAFTDFALADLTGAEAKVWLILFRDTKTATGTARTGQADIARRAGLSRRGVQVALDKLTAKGLVSVVRRGRLNAGPSIYAISPTGTHRVRSSSFLGEQPTRNTGTTVPLSQNGTVCEPGSPPQRQPRCCWSSDKCTS